MLTRKTDSSTISEHSEELATRKVQSLIKGWMEYLEKFAGWHMLPPSIKHAVRRGIVRVAWSAYGIGYLTKREIAE